MAGGNKRGVGPDEGQTPRAFFYSVGKASQEAKPLRDLEVVVETERKVVVEVDTVNFATFFKILIAEEAHVSYEAELLVEVERDAGLETDAPYYRSVTFIRLRETEVNTAVNEEANEISAEVGVTGIGVDFELVVSILNPSIVKTCADSPAVIEVIADFGSDSKLITAAKVSLCMSVAKRTTYINLCGYTECHNSHNGHN
jgi:hypothetical protein